MCRRQLLLLSPRPERDAREGVSATTDHPFTAACCIGVHLHQLTSHQEGPNLLLHAEAHTEVRIVLCLNSNVFLLTCVCHVGCEDKADSTTVTGGTAVLVP